MFACGALLWGNYIQWGGWHVCPLRQRRSPGVLLRCGELRTTNEQSSFTTSGVLHSWIPRLVGWSCAKPRDFLVASWSEDFTRWHQGYSQILGEKRNSNFEFSLTFPTIFFDQKNRTFLDPKNFRPKSFRIFFDEKNFDKKNSVNYSDPEFLQDSKNHA